MLPWISPNERTPRPKVVNFVLVVEPGDTLPVIERPFIGFELRKGNKKYPRNWRRVSWIMRRLRGHRCERCRSEENITVHHRGLSFAGRPGDRRDKHDVRLENLEVLCQPCHNQIEQELARREYCAQQRHRALGIGTGLVV